MMEQERWTGTVATFLRNRNYYRLSAAYTLSVLVVCGAIERVGG